jgi:uncharacterized protein YecA (UPF0149 family)
MLFEEEFPEAAEVLVSLCNANAEARKRGKRNKAFVMNPPEPIRNVRIGRNSPCICGSNKKYKKCCGR